MARSFLNIWGAAFFCIRVVFPKYIASHSLKKRAIFNSSVAVLKLVSNEHLVFNQTDFEKSINLSNIASKKTESSPQSSFLQSIAFDRLQTPGIGKRRKRQTTSQDDLKEIFSWNFNLNISRVERTSLHEVSKNKSVTSDGKKMGVAVYVNNQESVLSELQRTLDSVTSFLKNIFGGGIQNSTYDLKGMSNGEIKYPSKESQSGAMQDYYTRINTEKGKEPEKISRNPITESFQDVSRVSEFETGKKLSSLNLDGGSKNDSSVTKLREGRIFFDLFGLGGKLLGRTSSVSEVETTTISMDVAQTETDILRGENLPIHMLQQKPERVTENSNQEANFNSNSLKSSIMVPVKDSTDSTDNLPFQQITQLLECPGCVTNSSGFQFIPNKVEEQSKDTILETTDSTETLFTDEVLENFCKTLPNDLSQSHPSQRTDGESEADATMADSFLVNIPTTEFSVQTDKESRFFRLFDSGSGRSEITSNKDITSFGQVNESSKFPTVLDCLLFFSKKRDTFVNPNDTENSTVPNFEHTPVVPNFKEQKLQFSSNLNSSVQTLDEIPEGTETDLGKSKTLLGDENDFTVKDLSGKQETNSEPNDFNLSNKLSISESTDLDGVKKTDDRRDGKFLSFFGFGSGSEVQENGSLSERFFNSFFSSGARSLEDFGGLEETFGSGDSLAIEGFSGDGTVLPVFGKDLSEDTSIASGDPRFLSILGFAGSGDGRELTESSELIVTELSNRVDSKCNCSQDVKQLHKCDYECNFENVRDPKNTDNVESGTHFPFNESGCDDCYSNAEVLNNDNSSISTSGTSNDRNITVYFDEKPEKCNCFRGNDKNEQVSECDCSLDTVQASDIPYIDPENNFSTEIHLFNDSTGINKHENCNDCDNEKYNENPMLVTSLLETPGLTYQIKADETDKEIENLSYLAEVNNTSFTLESINTEENMKEVHKTTRMKPRRFMGTIFLTGSGDGGLFGDDTGPINLEEEERTVNPLVHSRRRGRFEDFPVDSSCDDCGDLSDVLQERGLERPQTNWTENNFSNSSTIEFSDNVPTSPITKSNGEVTTLTDNINKDSITLQPVIANEPSSSLNVPLDLQYRPCVSARDCNVTLDERCIRINSSSLCECGRTFVRQKLTGKCVAKRRAETSLKLPAEMFHPDLKDPESARYKMTTEKSIDTMWLLLDETPDIRQIVTEVNVSKFTAGSLIISMYLVIAVENEDEAGIINRLEEKLRKALLDDNLMKKSSLNIRNATVLSVFKELDPCQSSELNYCSRNAYCKRTEDSQRSYACYCKDHFADVSSDPLFPGEKCIAKCPPKYCGPNGHCEIIEDEMHCLCNGMYFGERCEVPGLVILCSLTVTAIISLIVLCAVIMKLGCRKTSYGGSPTFHRNEDIGPHAIAAFRVSDAIALAENPGAKVSKFAPISTPLPPVTIRVTQPTLTDSSISFECDSSFNATPRSERADSTGN